MPEPRKFHSQCGISDSHVGQQSTPNMASEWVKYLDQAICSVREGRVELQMEVAWLNIYLYEVVNSVNSTAWHMKGYNVVSFIMIVNSAVIEIDNDMFWLSYGFTRCQLSRLIAVIFNGWANLLATGISSLHRPLRKPQNFPGQVQRLVMPSAILSNSDLVRWKM